MLEDVIGVNMLDGVIGCVDMWVAIFECGLKHERRRIAISVCRSVIRASVSTLTFNVGDVGILDGCELATF